MIVVLPVCEKDAANAIQNLEWSIELDGIVPFNCMLSTEMRFDSTRIEELARRYFSGVTVFRYPAYPRNLSNQWPRPQNWAWRNAALHVSRIYREPWLWWEQDAIPVKRGWLDALNTDYAAYGKPFLGAIGALTQAGQQPHLNGVAIYPHDWQRMASQSMIYSETTPFDVAGGWRVFANAAITPNIKHVWSKEGPLGPAPTFTRPRDKWEMVGEAFLFHRNKDGSLVRLLRSIESDKKDQKVKHLRKIRMLRYRRKQSEQKMMQLIK